MLFMLLTLLGVLACTLLVLFALLLVLPSGYTAYMSVRRSKSGEHLRHYRLHALEQSLRS